MINKDYRYRPIEIVHDFNFIPCTYPQDAELPEPRQRLRRLKELASKGYASISTDATTLLSLKKENAEATVFLLVNFGDEAVEDVKLSGKDGEMTIYDPDTNAVQESLAIPPRSCRIVRVMKQ